MERERITAELAASPGSWIRGQVDLTVEVKRCGQFGLICDDVRVRILMMGYQGSAFVATRPLYGRETDDALFLARKAPAVLDMFYLTNSS